MKLRIADGWKKRTKQIQKLSQLIEGKIILLWALNLIKLKKSFYFITKINTKPSHIKENTFSPLFQQESPGPHPRPLHFPSGTPLLMLCLSRGFLLLTFVRGISESRHQRIWNQHEILRFFDTHIAIFQEKIFLGLISTIKFALWNAHVNTLPYSPFKGSDYPEMYSTCILLYSKQLLSNYSS